MDCRMREAASWDENSMNPKPEGRPVILSRMNFTPSNSPGWPAQPRHTEAPDAACTPSSGGKQSVRTGKERGARDRGTQSAQSCPHRHTLQWEKRSSKEQTPTTHGTRPTLCTPHCPTPLLTHGLEDGLDKVLRPIDLDVWRSRGDGQAQGASMQWPMMIPPPQHGQENKKTKQRGVLFGPTSVDTHRAGREARLRPHPTQRYKVRHSTLQ